MFSAIFMKIQTKKQQEYENLVNCCDKLPRFQVKNEEYSEF